MDHWFELYNQVLAYDNIIANSWVTFIVINMKWVWYFIFLENFDMQNSTFTPYVVQYGKTCVLYFTLLDRTFRS